MDGSNLCTECMDWIGVPRTVNIRWFSERMLWGICDIQLYEILAELLEWRSWFGSGFGDKASGVSYIPAVLFISLGNGPVIHFVLCTCLRSYWLIDIGGEDRLMHAV